MTSDHSRSFAALFGPSRRLACACGREHRLHTREVLSGDGALEASAGRVEADLGSAARVWVLSDGNTDAAAGARWRRAARAGAIVSRVLPARPLPVPSTGLVAALGEDARAARPDLVVGVGSGVVSDLAKCVSQDLGVPNWCIATAPSVDAYASATAALRVRGYHRAVPARPSELIACEPAVMEEAPRELYYAGFGDLLAKIIAYLDWNLSRVVAGEWYCPTIAEAAFDASRAALSAARLLDGDRPAAARALTDACLVSGLAMQAAGGSRPAASAEHAVAHWWETVECAREKRWALHGIYAAAAARLVLPGYRALYGALAAGGVDAEARLARWDAEERAPAPLEEALRPWAWRVEEETGSRRMDRGTLAGRLQALRESRSRIAAFAAPLVGELAAAVDDLGRAGYPLRPSDLGMDTGDALLPVRNVRRLRNRYSSFDLAWEAGLDGEMYRAIEDAAGA